MRWVRDVDDDVDLAEVAPDGGGGMDVAAAVVAVAVRAETAGLPLPQAHRMHGLGDAPDDDPVLPRCVRIGVTAHLGSLEGGDQLAVSDIELAGPRVLRTGNPVHHLRRGR